jgi:hypothetical protein
MKTQDLLAMDGADANSYESADIAFDILLMKPRARSSCQSVRICPRQHSYAAHRPPQLRHFMLICSTPRISSRRCEISSTYLCFILEFRYHIISIRIPGF